MALEVLYGYDTGIKKEGIYSLSTLVSRPHRHPFTGQQRQ